LVSFSPRKTFLIPGGSRSTRARRRPAIRSATGHAADRPALAANGPLGKKHPHTHVNLLQIGDRFNRASPPSCAVAKQDAKRKSNRRKPASGGCVEREEGARMLA
jgi:hypothetical protein